jgi:hypothetical protein
MHDWRDGDVDTLAQLQGHIRRLAERWMNSDDAKRRIMDKCAEWFKPVEKELNEKTKVICDEYDIPAASLKITANFDPGRVLPKIDGVGNPLENKVDLAGVIVAIVIATLLGGGGVALLMSGPIGWIIGLIIGMVAVGMGRDKAQEIVMNSRIPFGRSLLLSDTKISNALTEARAKLRSDIKETLAKGDAFKEITKNVHQQLKSELEKKADDARLLIK